MSIKIANHIANILRLFRKTKLRGALIFANGFVKIRDFILDFLFPKHCLGCQKEGSFICANCFGNIEINQFSTCFICSKRSVDNRVCPDCKKKTKLAGILIASSWDNLLLRQLIYEYKYRFIQDISKPLSQLLIDFLKTTNLYYQPIDEILLIPVPLHNVRLYWRGFNQAEFLAKEISNYFNMPMVKLLERKRNTRPQVEIKKQKERKKNIESAFELNKNYVSFLPASLKLQRGERKQESTSVSLDSEHTNKFKNKIIILIDDITTTGSTLEECAKILKQLKPKEIWGLVLARG